ncbi:MAG: hypothetical protein R3E13_04055 [Alphaproteobacteria bacterium]
MKPLGISKEEIEKLADFLKTVASGVWQKNKHDQYVIELKYAEPLQTPSEHIAPKLLNKLKKYDITNFTLLAESISETTVLSCENKLGQQFAIRSGYRREDRSTASLVLQTCDSAEVANTLKRNEIMLLLPIFNKPGNIVPNRQEARIPLTRSKEETLRKLFTYITEGTGFKWDSGNYSITRELAFLPNGLPLHIDPDHLIQPSNKKEAENGIKIMVERINELDLPEQLRWVDENGTPEQNKFLHSPYV